MKQVSDSQSQLESVRDDGLVQALLIGQTGHLAESSVSSPANNICRVSSSSQVIQETPATLLCLERGD